MRLKTTFRSSVKNFLIRQIQGSADDLTEIWRELFKLIDNDDGQLTAQELVSIEESLGVNISEAEAAEIIQRYDTDGNNLLSLEEFIFYKESQCWSDFNHALTILK